MQQLLRSILDLVQQSLEQYQPAGGSAFRQRLEQSTAGLTRALGVV